MIIKQSQKKRKNNKNKLIYYVLLFFVVAILWNLGADYYAHKFHEDIQSHKKVFVYEQNEGVINPVLVITDLDYKDSLISYYKKKEKGMSDSEFYFPLKTVPFSVPCYLLGYKDSLLAEIVYYANNDLKSHNYVRGYVYSKIIKNNPPPDSLLEKRLKIQREENAKRE